MKVNVSIDENIELHFDRILTKTESGRLRAIGFKRTISKRGIGFKGEQANEYKWYAGRHPAYIQFAENLKQSLQNGEPLEKVGITPSYTAELHHLEANHFSVVDITFLKGEKLQQESFIIFDPFLRIAKDIANSYAKVKFKNSVKEIEVFPKTQKIKARKLFKEGKILPVSMANEKEPEEKEGKIKAEKQPKLTSNERSETTVTIHNSDQKPAYTDTKTAQNFIEKDDLHAYVIDFPSFEFEGKSFEAFKAEIFIIHQDDQINWQIEIQALPLIEKGLELLTHSLGKKAILTELYLPTKDQKQWMVEFDTGSEHETISIPELRAILLLSQEEIQGDQKKAINVNPIGFGASSKTSKVITHSKGESVPNIWPPKGIQEPFISKNFTQEDLKVLKKIASKGLWDIIDDTLSEADAQQLFELIQLGHPDEYEIRVNRSDLLDEWSKRGEEVFKALAWPIDKNYPYVNVHTGYGSLKTLEEALGERQYWWTVAEHWRPVADLEKGVEILDQLIQQWSQEKEGLVNPKTQKPFSKHKDQYNSLSWKLEKVQQSREWILAALKPTEKPELSKSTPSPKKETFSKQKPSPKAEQPKPTEPKLASPSENFKKLKSLATFLDQHEYIDGWIQDGAIKKEFARKGKAAFKELASSLGLAAFKVDFNKGGQGVSGELNLMGMFFKDKGIYLKLTLDGIGSPKVLYRSIQHLKDYSGGSNHFFPIELLHHPSEIQQKIFRLLDFNKEVEERNNNPSENIPPPSSEGKTALEEVPPLLKDLNKLTQFIAQQEKGKEWTEDQRKEFSRLGKPAFKGLADYLGLKQVEVQCYLDDPKSNVILSLRGMFTDDIGMSLSYTHNTKNPSPIFFDHYDSDKQEVEVFSEKILETPKILKDIILRFLQQRVKQREEKSAFQPDTKLNFFQNFIRWFSAKDQHLPAHQISWSFFKKWCRDHYPDVSKEWVETAWELWDKHRQMLAKISSLSNGKLSPNLQKHYQLLQKSGMAFENTPDSIENFKSWVKHNYPWFTDQQIEKAAQEKEKHDQLKKSIADDFKRKHVKRIPLLEIKLSINRTEEEGAPEFDFNQARIFEDWKGANAYVQKLSRALVPAFAVRLVWENGFAAMLKLPTPDGKSKEPLSDLIFEGFFEAFYNSIAWPEELSRQAGLIIEKYQLYSMAEPSAPNESADYLDQVIAYMHDLYFQAKRATPKQIEKLADQLAVPTMGQMWEAVELSWLLWYRSIYLDRTPFEQRLEKMVHFWTHVQPTYAYADSSKILYQQYSTPCPIGAIVAQYCKLSGTTRARAFEPSAGNGLLLVGADPKNTHVNEIDPTRLESLKFQGFSKITQEDATQPFPDEWANQYDVVLTNPPFTQWVDDQWDKDQIISKYFHGQIGLAKHIRLEHLMAGLALHCMKDDGRAAIIIMGHVYFKDGLIAKYRPFFNWLYRHYQVDDVINLNSFKLYNKQGAVAKTMLILIKGRKPKPEGVAPTEEEAPHLFDIEDSFQNLWQRVKGHLTPFKIPSSASPLNKILEQLKIELS